MSCFKLFVLYFKVETSVLSSEICNHMSCVYKFDILAGKYSF